MKRGVNCLATVAAVAPLLGILITVDGIVGSFIGCGGEKSICMATVVDRLANAIARGAIGLLVGILASLYYRYLQAKLEGLDMEMRNATLELANALSLLLRNDTD
jgi:biopolymer transport protein ExbB/TolQ